MIIQREKIIIGAEALAGAIVGACAGVFLIPVPWMWRTFTSGAPSEQTAIARTIASGIERVLSIFVNWPEWIAAALAGAVVGAMVGLIVGGIVGFLDRSADPELPGTATGIVIGVLVGFVALGSIGTLIAGYGLGLATGLIIGVYPGGMIGFLIGGFTGEMLCGFIGKSNEKQYHRVREAYKREQAIGQKKIYNEINTLVAYFIEKMQEIGNPGLVEPSNDPFLDDPYISKYAGSGKERGDRSKLPWHSQGVWWSGVTALICASINPDGEWRYIAPVYNNTTNEIEYYWEISSAEDREELDLSFPYEPYGATCGSAYNNIRSIILDQLKKHYPSALTELPSS